MPDNHKKVLEFIQAHELAVLATVTSDFKPESSVVGFAVNDNFEIYFGTYNISRKWINLQKNSKVALVIGWEQGKTVQYEGDAVEMSGEDRAEVLKIYFSNRPSLAKYVSNREMAMFKVTPTWIRYSDLSQEPIEKIEIRI